MNLVLLLPFVVALSVAAPQNYTSHFQIFQVPTTDSSIPATETTVYPKATDIGTKSSNGTTNTTSGTTNGTGDANSVTSESTFSADGATSTNKTGGIAVATFGASSSTAGTTVVSDGGKTDKTEGVTNGTTTDSAKNKTLIDGVTDSTTIGSVRDTTASDGDAESTTIVSVRDATASDSATDATITEDTTTDGATSTMSTGGTTSTTEGTIDPTVDATAGVSFTTYGATSIIDAASFLIGGGTSTKDDDTSSTDDATATTDATTSTADGNTSAANGTTATAFKVTTTVNSATTTADGITSTEDSVTSTTVGGTFPKDDDIYTTIGASTTTEGVSSTTLAATSTTGGATSIKRRARSLTDGATDTTDGTDGVTEASIDVNSHNDDVSETHTVSLTSTSGSDSVSSAGAPTKVEEDLSTIIFPFVFDRSDLGGGTQKQRNSTLVENDTVEQPGVGFTFTLPSFFTTILEAASVIEPAHPNGTRSGTPSHDVSSSGSSGADTHSLLYNGGLTIDSTPPSVLSNSTTTDSSSSSESYNSSGSAETGTSFISSRALVTPDFSMRSGGQNSLSTSDFFNPQAQLNQGYLTRKKRSQTELQSRGYPGGFSSSSPSFYHHTPLTALDEEHTYYTHNNPHTSPAVRTPDLSYEPSSHAGNSGGYPGQFQYIIRTSNLPGVLASFPASSGTSQIPSDSHNSYSFHNDPSSANPQSNSGHLGSASHPANGFSSFPNFQSSSNFNLGSNSESGSFGSTHSVAGSSTTERQNLKADSATETQRLNDSDYSTTSVPLQAEQTTLTATSDSSKRISDSTSKPKPDSLATTTEALKATDGEDATDKPTRIF